MPKKLNGWFYEDLQDLLAITPPPQKKDVLFIIGDAKAGCQEIPKVTGKFSLGAQNEAGQRLTVFLREHTGHSEHPLPTTYFLCLLTLYMDITRWSILKSD